MHTSTLETKTKLLLQKKTINTEEKKETEKRNVFERGVHRLGKRCRERGGVWEPLGNFLGKLDPPVPNPSD
jgi:hypothetical protein